jgi:hypothetical protein
MQHQQSKARRNKTRDEARDAAQADDQSAVASWSSIVRAIATVAAFVGQQSPNYSDPRSAYTQAENSLMSCDGDVAAALRGLSVSVDGVPAAIPITLAPAVALLSGVSDACDASDALRDTSMNPIAAFNLMVHRALTAKKLSVHMVTKGDVYYGEALLQEHIEGRRSIELQIAAGMLPSDEGETFLQSSDEISACIKLWVVTDSMMKVHIYNTYPACRFELIKVDGDCFFRSAATLLFHLLGVFISHTALRAVVAAALSDAAARGNEVHLNLTELDQVAMPGLFGPYESLALAVAFLFQLDVVVVELRRLMGAAQFEHRACCILWRLACAYFVSW